MLPDRLARKGIRELLERPAPLVPSDLKESLEPPDLLAHKAFRE